MSFLYYCWISNLYLGQLQQGKNQVEQNSWAFWISLTAGCMHIIAFVIYNWQIFAGTSKPNTATWTLWSFLTMINFGTFNDMTKDLVKSFLPGLSSIACLLTFLIALKRGSFKRLRHWDEWTCLGLGIVSGLVWVVFRSSAYANLLLQWAVAVSFWPTIKGVRNDPRVERPLPWMIFTIAYTLMMVVLMMEWDGKWIPFVYPINCFILHGIVGLYAMRQPHAFFLRSQPEA